MGEEGIGGSFLGVGEGSRGCSVVDIAFVYSDCSVEGGIADDIGYGGVRWGRQMSRCEEECTLRETEKRDEVTIWH